MREVIVGIDRSRPSPSTVAQAASAAEDRGTNLHLVMCVPGATIEPGDTLCGELIDAERFLLPFVRSLTAIEFTWMVGVGDLGSMLTEEARRLRATTVVIADDAPHFAAPGVEVVRVPETPSMPAHEVDAPWTHR